MEKTLEVPLPPELQELIDKAQCYQLPQPAPAQLTLPSGGHLKAIADITKGIPDSCALNFNLLVQLAPLLVSLDCLIKLLDAIDKLKDAAGGMLKGDVSGLKKFIKAADKLAPCIAMISGVPLFVKDILCLIIKVLGCIIGSLETLVDVMGGITVQIDLAGKNSEREAALQCALENAQTSAAHTMNALESLFGIMKLAEPLMGMANVPAIQTPTFGDQHDIESLKTTLQTLETVRNTLTLAVQALGLGGCDA